MPEIDPKLIALFNQAALAVMLVLLIAGFLIPKPAHEFVVKLLGLAHDREAKMVEELDKHSDTIVALSGRLEKNTDQIARLENVINELQRGPR
jgi:hypothetical protein